MAEQQLNQFRLRRIQRNARRTRNTLSFNSRTGRIRTFQPSNGDFFTDSGLAEAIPPRGATQYKIVRRDPGYVRDDNPLGLRTDGPFSIDISPQELVDNTPGLEPEDISKILYDSTD